MNDDQIEFEERALQFVRERNKKHQTLTSRLSAEGTDQEIAELWDSIELVDENDFSELVELKRKKAEKMSAEKVFVVPNDLSVQDKSEIQECNARLSLKIVSTAKKPDRRLHKYLGFAVAATVLGIAIFIPGYYGIPQTYKVAKGQQHTIQLNDGTTVLMDSGSELSLSEGWGRRLAVLDKGAAYFSVTKNPHKPFMIDSGETQVLVLGTKFSVYRKEEYVEVVVETGRVNVSADDGGYNRDLEKKERLVIAENKVVDHQTDINIDEAMGWQKGRLYFKQESLERIVSRMSDYYGQPMNIMNDSIRETVLTGSFEIGDVNGFLESFKFLTGAKIEKNAAGEILIF